MLFAAGILLYLAVWAALLHWHGAVSDELAATRAELNDKESRLKAWHDDLDAKLLALATGGRCHSTAECTRNVSRGEAYGRVIAAYDELVDGLAAGEPVPPGGDDAGGVPSSTPPAASPDEDRPNGPRLLPWDAA